MPAKTTPAEAAAAVAHEFRGVIETCAISEDMEGMWAVVARIKPADGRRARFQHSAIGETREEAIANFIEEAKFTASVN